jgi:hypothetical protein
MCYQKGGKFNRKSIFLIFHFSKLLERNFSEKKMGYFRGLGYLRYDNVNEQHNWLWSSSL